jgi:hypothetical protein
MPAMIALALRDRPPTPPLPAGWAVALALALALALAPRDARACTSSDQCKGGRVCEAGECVDRAGCTKDTECSGDLLCHEGSCQAGCTKDTECSGDLVCTDGFCAANVPAAPVAPTDPAPPAPVAPAPVAPAPAPAATQPWAGAPPPQGPMGPPPPGAESPPTFSTSGPDTTSDDRRLSPLGGAILFGSIGLGTYLITIPITAAASDGRATDLAAIPLAGPFAILGEHDLTAGGQAFYILDGVVQIVGVGLAVVGLVTYASEKNDTARVVPWADPGSRAGGLSLQGPTF